MLDLLKAKSVLYIKLAVKGLYWGQKKKKNLNNNKGRSWTEGAALSP